MYPDQADIFHLLYIGVYCVLRKAIHPLRVGGHYYLPLLHEQLENQEFCDHVNTYNRSLWAGTSLKLLIRTRAEETECGKAALAAGQRKPAAKSVRRTLMLLQKLLARTAF